MGSWVYRREIGVKPKGRATCLGFVMLIALAGCSSVSPFNPQQLADAYLVQEVLRQDAVLRQIGRECSRLYPETMPLAYEAQSQWWKGNSRWTI